MHQQLRSASVGLGKRVLDRFGFDLIRKYGGPRRDIPDYVLSIWEQVSPYTMTSLERVTALVDAVDYIVMTGIEGSLVECGVWRGGSSMAMALRLDQLGATDRDLFLFDTFSGMTSPTDVDVNLDGLTAAERFGLLATGPESSTWALAPEAEVRQNLKSTGYPHHRIHFVRGKVEDTLPSSAPESIAMLRLDTDWYESTKHELVHLYPRLEVGGILLIDDYGHWAGSRIAVDEYLSDRGIRVFLGRIDYSGRIAVKQAP